MKNHNNETPEHCHNSGRQIIWALIHHADELNLKPAEICVLQQIAKHDYGNGAAIFPSEKTIGKVPGINRATVKRAKRRLSEEVRWKGWPVLSWKTELLPEETNKRNHSSRPKHCIYDLSILRLWAESVWLKTNHTKDRTSSSPASNRSSSIPKESRAHRKKKKHGWAVDEMLRGMDTWKRANT